MKKSLLIVFLVVLADQILKIWVKLNMRLGESISIIGDRIQLYFIENEGMAFGMAFGGDWGKLLLTLIRIVAVVLLFVFVYKLTKGNKVKTGLVISLSLIIAGAMGNIFDSVFYGVLFSESTPFHAATFLPEGGGYAPLLHGKVVDMFYCPIIRGIYPQWFPFVGGDSFIFFRPIFNIADSAITVGCFWLLIGYRKFFSKTEEIIDDEILDNDTTL